LATDARVLLQGLEEYYRALARHSIYLKLEYNHLDARWQQFSSIYEGDAADQFRAGWSRTHQNFSEYMEQTERISKVLEERIEALREADKTESGLIG
jgi:uncharacterized protein YukE